ncbi:hypothetical protein ACH4T9_31130 [Micromonospora sp. NPDC020750]|uniref:hypothetical protein n=1 Tax=unclassified Micromonospora TaxID=2617518 RepID=UPI0037A78989
MAWIAPMTAVANSVFTAAQFNAHVRDNLNETAAAKATSAGRIFVATGPNALAERQVGSATVTNAQTTTSTLWTDLSTVGPTVTITTGTTVIVALSCLMSVSAAGSNSQMGVAVSGASTIAANTDDAVIAESSAANDLYQVSYVFPITGLTAGTNTFTAKYQVGISGTGSFSRRRIVVFPFG